MKLFITNQTSNIITKKKSIRKLKHNTKYINNCSILCTKRNKKIPIVRSDLKVAVCNESILMSLLMYQCKSRSASMQAEVFGSRLVCII